MPPLVLLVVVPEPAPPLPPVVSELELLLVAAFVALAEDPLDEEPVVVVEPLVELAVSPPPVVPPEPFPLVEAAVPPAPPLPSLLLEALPPQPLSASASVQALAAR